MAHERRGDLSAPGVRPRRKSGAGCELVAIALCVAAPASARQQWTAAHANAWYAARPHLIVGMINRGLVDRKTQARLSWDSWQRPYTADEPTV